MGALQRFERRLGGLVEGAFARIFKGGVEPVELAAALRRETDNQRTITATRVLVPNEFTISLSPGDHSRLGPYAEALEAELAEIVREHAAEMRYAFVGPVIVRFEVDDDIDIGVSHVRSAAVVDPAAESTPDVGPGVDPSGRWTRRPEPEVSRLVLASGGHAHTGSYQAAGFQREFPLTRAGALIGRSTEADIRLSDTGVSRRHGQVMWRQGRWIYQDLGSTNGSTVNGRPVGRYALRDGDRLELGHSVLVYRAGSDSDGHSGQFDDELSGSPAEA